MTMEKEAPSQSPSPRKRGRPRKSDNSEAALSVVYFRHSGARLYHVHLFGASDDEHGVFVIDRVEIEINQSPYALEDMIRNVGPMKFRHLCDRHVRSSGYGRSIAFSDSLLPYLK